MYMQNHVLEFTLSTRQFSALSVLRVNQYTRSSDAVYLTNIHEQVLHYLLAVPYMYAFCMCF